MTVDPTVPRKLGLKPGMRVLLLGAPDGYRQGLGAAAPGVALEVPPDATTEPADVLEPAKAAPTPEPADAVQLFCRDRAELDRLGPATLAATRPGVLLWVCYPKGTSRVPTDLGRDVDWGPLAAAGFRPVAAVSVDGTWSALRFRPAAEVGRHVAPRPPRPATEEPPLPRRPRLRPCPSAAPHSPQKRSPGKFALPHEGQARASGAPHSAQNLRSGRLSVPQRTQRNALPFGVGRA